MRKIHTLSRVGPTPYPQGIIVVQASCSQQYLSESDDVGTMTLSLWHAQWGHVENGVISWDGSKDGATAERWWALVKLYISTHKTVHIYSWQAREVMAALGIWDKLADGDYTLRMHDPCDRPEESDTSGRDTQGYVVLEGPPTIVAFAVADAPGRLTWLDPANYGITSIVPYVQANDGDLCEQAKFGGELWTDGEHAKPLASAVADWLEHYYSALELYHLGGPEHTAATQAMSAFRGHYMKHRIVCHDSVDVLRMERAALHGGRCECYFIGDLYAGNPALLPGQGEVSGPCVRREVGPLYMLDANAMYPAIAGSQTLPVRLQGVCGRTDVHTLIAACKACGVIADVQIKTDVACVPLRLADRTVYPVGTFDTVLCGPEILWASQCCARIKCRRLALYEMAPIYHGMVAKLWQARQQYAADGNERMRAVIKAILNASFGKWAQRTKRWHDVASVLPLRPYMQWWESDDQGGTEQYRAIGWQVQRMHVLDEEQADTCPAITAYINSHGRVYLHSLMRTAGEGNVYYCDTDSMLVNQAGFAALIDNGCIQPKVIGCLKIVSQPTHARIIGRQAYELDGVLTISGAKGKCRKAGDSYVEELVAPPIGYYLSHGDPPGLERRIARVRVTRAYNQGNVHEDGTVTPVRFDGGERLDKLRDTGIEAWRKKPE